MVEKSQLHIIDSEQANSAKTWAIPPIVDADKILSSAEKEAKERRERLLKRSKETIETVDVPSMPKGGISAKQMQAVMDSVENDGFKQGHKEGFAKGHTEGYEAGRLQALTEMRAELDDEKKRFAQITEFLLNPMEEQDQQLEHMLLDIICTLTQSVIQRELLTDSSVIVDLIKTAVNVLPVGSHHIRIYLNPADITLADTYAKEQQLEWQFVADTTLSPGGCRVETPESRVDFSVSSRLQTVLEKFITKQLAVTDVVAKDINS
jgi:flagellar assembly protein FliH